MDPYFTIVIAYQELYKDDPWMPHEATGPFSTLSRGAFPTKSEARAWARTHLPKAARFRCREVLDPTRYRVTLICKCANDAAEGYGATVKEARANAITFFRKDHGRRAKWQTEITEHAVTTAGGSSHYEELPS